MKNDIQKSLEIYFNNTEKTVAYSEIKKVYLILLLENGLHLPISKLGFTYGKWDDFIPYFKQKTGLK